MYKIIKNKKEFNKFINILPELNSNECYYIRLITRSKYVEKVKTDYDIKHITIRDKSKIFQSIRQLECENDLYDGLSEIDIAIYITLNLRSYKECLKRILITFSKLLGQYNNEDLEYLFYKQLRHSCSRKTYFDFDFDNVDLEETKKKVLKFINKDCVFLLPTKKGIHFIVDIDKVNKEKYLNWEKNIKNIKGFDWLMESGDNMIPIPGCSQFGYVPCLEKLT